MVLQVQSNYNIIQITIQLQLYNPKNSLLNCIVAEYKRLIVLIHMSI
jgi:hypothetical protein